MLRDKLKENVARITWPQLVKTKSTLQDTVVKLELQVSRSHLPMHLHKFNSCSCVTFSNRCAENCFAPRRQRKYITAMMTAVMTTPNKTTTAAIIPPLFEAFWGSTVAAELRKGRAIDVICLSVERFSNE